MVLLLMPRNILIAIPVCDGQLQAFFNLALPSLLYILRLDMLVQVLLVFESLSAVFTLEGCHDE